MPLFARIVLGLCGVALALYAAASLAGLVTPPWWERSAPLTVEEWYRRYYAAAYDRWPGPHLPRSPNGPVFDMNNSGQEFGRKDAPWNIAADEARNHVEPGAGREAISIGVGSVGLTLAGFAVLGRRRAEAR